MAEETQQSGSSENQSQNQSQETSIVNVDGSFIDNWSDKYPETDRPTLSRFKKFDDLVTSHMSMRKKFGKNPDSLVEIPNETSTDEVKAAFHKARGVPDTAEEYKYERNTELSENIQIDDDKIAAFSQIAKSHNLTPPQFNGVVNDYLALIDKDITASDVAGDERLEQEREKGVAVLKKQLGNALEERTLRAEAMMRKYGDRVVKDAEGNEINILERLYEELPDIQNSPWIRLLFDNIAEDMSEDRIKGLTSVTTPTPDAIQDKINELKAHTAFMDRTHPQHKQVVDELTELYKKKSA